MNAKALELRIARGRLRQPLTPPPPGQVDLWWLPVEATSQDNNLLERPLSAEERARAGRFRSSALRSSYLVAHFAMRAVLGAYTSGHPSRLHFARRCRFCGAGHGKPALSAGVGLNFSLSRAEGRSVLAVAGQSMIGVDAESLARTNLADELRTQIMSEEERVEHRSSHTSLTKPLSIWTRKEALLKATGHGLVIAPRSVWLQRCSGGAWRPRRAEHLAHPEEWQVLDLDAGPGHVGAVASQGDIESIVYRSIELVP